MNHHPLPPELAKAQRPTPAPRTTFGVLQLVASIDRDNDSQQRIYQLNNPAIIAANLKQPTNETNDNRN